MLRVLLTVLLLFALPALAEEPPEVEGKYASIVVDADTLEIVHARQIDELRYPASLTKVMTLVLVFDAIAAGEITTETVLTTSATAAKASPVKIYLKEGQTITVDEAIRAVAVRSANDAAVVLAEHIAGSEAAFAERMTERARSFGMKSTVFRTANGLPDPHQVTTARDMAKLASTVLRTYPEHYHYFGLKSFTWRGKTRKNTNGLLHALPGVDGFKTGFTNASGYNLIISAERDERRLIAVVLGGASGKSRNVHMTDLVEKSFERMGVAPVLNPIQVADAEPIKRDPEPQLIQAISLRRSDGTTSRIASRTFEAVNRIGGEWAVGVGRFGSVEAAHEQLGALFGLDPALTRDNAFIRPSRGSYESRFTGLDFDTATRACGQLAGLAGGCRLISPSRSASPRSRGATPGE